MVRAVVAVATAVLVGGCGSSSADRFLGFPNDTDADALVFAVPGPTGHSFVAVAAADAEFRLDLITDNVAATPLEALTYDATLGELGLSAGAVEPAPTGDIGRPLPPPDEMFRLRLDDGEPGWESRTEVSADTLAFRRRICDPVEPVSETWAVEGFVRFAVPIDDRLVLFSTTDGLLQKMFVSDGGTPVEVAPPLPNGEVPWSAWRGPDDQLWFGDFRGKLYRGTVDSEGIRGMQIVFDFGLARVDDIDGHEFEDGSIEIFAVASSGAIARGDGTTFALVDGTVTGTQLRIMWRAPGEASVAVYEEEFLARVVGDAVVRDTAPPGEIFAISYVEAIGEVIGIRSGEFYGRRGDGEWERLGPSLTVHPMGIAPIDGGFMYLMASGRVGRYFEPEGFCPNFGVLPILGFDGFLTTVGDDLFAVGELNSGMGITQGARVAY